MKTYGVLDRITDGKYGTILAEEIGKEFIVKKDELPKGSLEGTWFNLIIEHGELKSITINQTLTKKRKVRIESTLDRLRKKSGSKYRK